MQRVRNSSFIAAMLLLAAGLVLGACGKRGAEANSVPAQSGTEYATKLKIWEERGIPMAAVYEASDTVHPLGTYIFASKEKAEVLLKRYPDALAVKPGGGNLLLYTTVHASVLSELGAVDQIGSVVDADYFTDPEIRRRIASGLITDMGISSSPLKEKLIARKPSLAVVSSYSGMDVSALRQLGIPILYLTENQENDPLGRAEWIKLLGLLTGKRAQADSIFNSVKTDYLQLREVASKVKERPKVMTENMYQGIWYVAGGGSDVASMISDAGGDYAWSDDKSEGSLSLSFEAVLSKAGDSDIWLMKIFGEELTAPSLLAKDSRYSLFKPFKSGGVWYSNTAKSRLFEEIPFHPDRLLKEYIKIFHPELLPDYKLVYYTPMGK